MEAVNRGADGYLIKPFDMNNLLDAIKEQFKKQEEAGRYNEEKAKESIDTQPRDKGFIS